MIIKITEESSNARCSAMDIARKSKMAITHHPKFFNSFMHQTRVHNVELALREYLDGWENIYITARPATRKRRVHTEVKFNKIQFRTKQQDVARTNFYNSLASLGIDLSTEVIYKPRTNSISILVF